MKKLRLVSVSIVFAALCLAFTACNQSLTAGQGTGTVRIVIDNGASRAVNAEGMPVFDESNTTITVTGEDGNQLAEGKTSVTLQVPAGKKITVTAIVTTAAGEWRGVTEHTVTEGTNTVAVKLSKTPLNVGNILVTVNNTQTELTLRLAGGTELLNGVQIGHNYMTPVTARDGRGRIYVLYNKNGFHFTRFDAEGGIDPGFETAIMDKLPTSTGIEIMAVDAKTNTIFVVDGAKHAYAVTETSHNVFTCSTGFDLTGLPDIGSNTIRTAAAYNGVLFLAVKTASVEGLCTYKVELTGTGLALTKKADAIVPIGGTGSIGA